MVIDALRTHFPGWKWVSYRSGPKVVYMATLADEVFVSTTLEGSLWRAWIRTRDQRGHERFGADAIHAVEAVRIDARRFCAALDAPTQSTIEDLP